MALCSGGGITCIKLSNTRIYQRRFTKNIRYPRRLKLPPELDPELAPVVHNPSDYSLVTNDDDDEATKSQEEEEEDEENKIEWEAAEIEAISSLFRGRIPQKPGKLNARVQSLPLPLPHKLRPLGLPSPKRLPKALSVARKPISSQVYKSPSFLIGLSKEIGSLSPDDNVSVVLDRWARFLRKGSLSITVRELGHMGLPERALQTFCWIQKQPHLFPDDRTLASTVEVLARSQQLKMPFDLDKFISLASRSVCEAMVRGFIKGGNLMLARKLLLAAKDGKRVLGSGVYTKLILELAKNPDRTNLVLALLEELAERAEFDLTLQDCTSLMKVCVRLRKFELVEGLYDWFKESGRNPSVVMYTTLIHGRYSERRYKEALSIVWEMEASNCLLDLPAYHAVIKLCVALNDLARTTRYFLKLKEAGFSPTYGIYRDLIKTYMMAGRVAKFKEVLREAEMAGFRFDMMTVS